MPVRIYELAHEFELTTKEVLVACREAGLDVKSHSSTIEDDEADAVRRHLSVLVDDVDGGDETAVAAPAAAPAPPPPPAEDTTRRAWRAYAANGRSSSGGVTRAGTDLRTRP